jgi:hypothetical protein
VSIDCRSWDARELRQLSNRREGLILKGLENCVVSNAHGWVIGRSTKMAGKGHCHGCRVTVQQAITSALSTLVNSLWIVRAESPLGSGNSQIDHCSNVWDEAILPLLAFFTSRLLMLRADRQLSPYKTAGSVFSSCECFCKIYLKRNNNRILFVTLFHCWRETEIESFYSWERHGEPRTTFGWTAAIAIMFELLR